MDDGMTFARPITDCYLEDYVEGDVHRFGTIAVETDELIAFAKRFEPQAMHTDPEAAKNTPFGDLIASGWYTAGLMMRLYVEHYLTHVASLASPGVDELRWLKPVRAENTLSVRVTVLKTAPLKIQARSGRGHLIRRGNQPGRRDRDDNEARQHHRQTVVAKVMFDEGSGFAIYDSYFGVVAVSPD
jgi:acyl dehydratase